MSRDKYEQEYLCAFPFDEPRGTGRTTAIAFELISQALRAKGSPVRAFDHYPGNGGAKHLRLVVMDICELMGFKATAFVKGSADESRYVELRIEPRR